MVKKTEERKDKTEIEMDIFKTWANSYTAVSKMWEDSYLKLYTPWLASTEKQFEKVVELSKDASPEKYKEFYEEWIKNSQKRAGKFYKITSVESNKELFEKFLVGAEESNKLYKSIIAELDANAQATRDILKREPDPEKYKEVYSMWVKFYGNVFDQLLTLPFRQNIKGIFENLTGTPYINSNTVTQISKLWNDSYEKLYGPYVESLLKLTAKSEEIARGNASPEAYKEFYTLWMNTYQETYGKLFDIQSAKPSREVFESFVKSANDNLKSTKTWIATLEKLSQKAMELSKQKTDPEAYKEFYSLWAKTYEKAFDEFFKNIPEASPFAEIMEPVKNAAKIYADTFTRMSKVLEK
jgi:hypothetical protein